MLVRLRLNGCRFLMLQFTIVLYHFHSMRNILASGHLDIPLGVTIRLSDVIANSDSRFQRNVRVSTCEKYYQILDTRERPLLEIGSDNCQHQLSLDETKSWSVNVVSPLSLFRKSSWNSESMDISKFRQISDK